MRFISVLSAMLLTSTAIAAPGTKMRRERHLQRQARKGNPLQRLPGSDGLLANTTQASYSTNWAGAVLVGTGYTEVTGTFTMPKPTTKGSGSVRNSYNPLPFLT